MLLNKLTVLFLGLVVMTTVAIPQVVVAQTEWEITCPLGCEIDIPFPSKFSMDGVLTGGGYGLYKSAAGIGEGQIDLRAKFRRGWGLSTQLAIGFGGAAVKQSNDQYGVALLPSWQSQTVRMQFGVGWKAMINPREGVEMTNVVFVPVQVDVFLHSNPLPGRFFVRFDLGIGAGFWRSKTVVNQNIGVDKSGQSYLADLGVHAPHWVSGAYWKAGIGVGFTWDFQRKN